MGATIITGSFSSGDCGQTIENLRKASTRYIINENGEREVDEDHFYDGTIYPIGNWKDFGDVDDINMSANEIRDKLDEIGMRLGYGNVQKRKYIRTIHARAEVERNTNSAADVRTRFIEI